MDPGDMDTPVGSQHKKFGQALKMTLSYARVLGPVGGELSLVAMYFVKNAKYIPAGDVEPPKILQVEGNSGGIRLVM